jgi:hypothetical protein
MMIEGKEIPARPDLAAPWLEKASAAGNKAATIKLAWMYIDGGGVSKNLDLGANYCEQGAKAGVPVAMTCLGNLYRYGKGRPTNANLAVDWYTKAAGCGEGTSMYNLSQMYLRGEGVKQDTVEAYALLLMAGRAITQAQRDAEALKGTSTSSQLKKADKEVVEFPTKHHQKLCLWK